MRFEDRNFRSPSLKPYILRSRAASVDVETLVYEAIKQGYRHLDCARCYTTEDHVGKALARHIAEGNIQREDVFITSKLFGSYHQPGMKNFCH